MIYNSENHSRQTSQGVSGFYQNSLIGNPTNQPQTPVSSNLPPMGNSRHIQPSRHQTTTSYEKDEVQSQQSLVRIGNLSEQIDENEQKRAKNNYFMPMRHPNEVQQQPQVTQSFDFTNSQQKNNIDQQRQGVPLGLIHRSQQFERPLQSQMIDQQQSRNQGDLKPDFESVKENQHKCQDFPLQITNQPAQNSTFLTPLAQQTKSLSSSYQPRFILKNSQEKKLSQQLQESDISQANPVEDQWQNIIDWVNSLDDPTCLLISSFEDLRDGIALCHIVGLLACNESDQLQLKQLIYYNHNEDGEKIEQNVDLALNVLKASSPNLPASINDLTAKQIQADPLSCFLFLETIRQASNMGILQQNENPKNDQEIDRQIAPNIQKQDFPAQNQQTETFKLNEEQNAFGQNNDDQYQEVKDPEFGQFRPDMVQSIAGYSQFDKNEEQKSLHEEKSDTSSLSSENGTAQPQSYIQNQTPQQMNSQTDKKSETIQNQSDYKAPLSQNRLIDSKISSQQKISSRNKNLISSTSPKKFDFKEIHKQKHEFKMSATEVISGASPLPLKCKTPKAMTHLRQKRPESVNINKNQQTSQPNYSNRHSASKSVTNQKNQSSYKKEFQKQAKKPNEQFFRQSSQHQISQNDGKTNQSGNTKSKFFGMKQHQSTVDQRELNQNKQSLFPDNHRQMLKQQSVKNLNSDLEDLKAEVQRLENQIDFEKQFQVYSPQAEQDARSFSQFDKIMSKSPRALSHAHPVVASEGYSMPTNQTQFKRYKETSRTPQQTDEENQVMSQMQRLRIKKEAIVVQPVDEKAKIRLTQWLQDDVLLLGVHLTVESLVANLPKYCQNGILFADLVNRLQGREPVIKGLNRNPKSVTLIQSNIRKVLDYLGSFPRFSTRYLWAQDKIITGDSDVIWGLLDDIWHWKLNKISPFDPSKPSLAIGGGSIQRKDLILGRTKQAFTSIESHKSTSDVVSAENAFNNLGPNQRKSRQHGSLKQYATDLPLQKNQSQTEMANKFQINQSQGRKQQIMNAPDTFNKEVYDFQNQDLDRNFQVCTKNEGPVENYHSFGNIEMQQSEVKSMFKKENDAQIRQSTNKNALQINATPRMKPPKAPSNQKQDQKTRQYIKDFQVIPRVAINSQATENDSYSQAPQQNSLQRISMSACDSPRGYSNNQRRAADLKSERSTILSSKSQQKRKSVHLPIQKRQSSQAEENIGGADTSSQMSQPSASTVEKALQKYSLLSDQKSNLGAQSVHHALFTPKVGIKQRELVDEWMQFLKFHPFFSKEFDFVALVQDPKRNGVFFAQLVSYLNPQNPLAKQLTDPSFIIMRPKTVPQCKQNFKRTFLAVTQIIKQDQIGSFQTRLLNSDSITAIMKGDSQVLYRVLYQFYQAFYAHRQQNQIGTLINAGGAFKLNSTGFSMRESQSVQSFGTNPSSVAFNNLNNQVVNTSSSRVEPLDAPALIMNSSSRRSNSVCVSEEKDLVLPYSAEEIILLDASLVQWLKQIGQLRALQIDINQVEAILDLEKVIRNGVLLCALISRVFRVKLTGIFKDPKVEASSLANIRKALKVLQTQRKMSQKFTWAEQGILKCNKGVTLGLLEDIHRYFDGLPARKRGQDYFYDGPYLGVTQAEVNMLWEDQQEGISEAISHSQPFNGSSCEEAQSQGFQKQSNQIDTNKQGKKEFQANKNDNQKDSAFEEFKLF